MAGARVEPGVQCRPFLWCTAQIDARHPLCCLFFYLVGTTLTAVFDIILYFCHAVSCVVAASRTFRCLHVRSWAIRIAPAHIGAPLWSGVARRCSQKSADVPQSPS